MQVSRFRGGGFVVHKAKLSGSPCRFSVWFNVDRRAIDAERFDRLNRASPVAAGQLARLGYLYRNADYGAPAPAE